MESKAKTIKAQIAQSVTDRRLIPRALDDLYIQAYLDNPTNKTKALQTAFKAAGIEKNATKQRAHEIHARLREQIDRHLALMARDYKALGLQKIAYLAEHAEAENVQLAAARELTKDLLPDVQIVKEQTLEDIDAELQAIEAEIAQTSPIQ